MSLHTALIARAEAAESLSELISGRVASEEGIQGWVLPYVILNVGPQVPELTFGGGPNIVKARVLARLYASSGVALDTLDQAWREAFSNFSGVSDNLQIDTWIEGSEDSDEEVLAPDTQSRVHVRIVDTMVAFVR